jgi:hypothetical protein
LANQLEIALTEANGIPVSLKSMSSEALDSFMATVTSLKSIAVSVVEEDSLNFSIQEGSAQCTIEAPKSSLDNIYDELSVAMKGDSEDKKITKNLRNIQNQMMRDNYKFRFIYRKSNQPDVDIYPTLIKAKKIALKRSKAEFNYKLMILSGFLNQIGGKNPNYHFDYGAGEKLTIDCTVEEATIINKYLYKNVQALLLCKEWQREDKRDEYYHKAILDKENVQIFRTYLKKYYKEEDLVKRLTLTHDFVDDSFANSNDGHLILFYLLSAFNSVHFHLSELKTLLVISKPFKGHEMITEARQTLLDTYKSKKQNS